MEYISEFALSNEIVEKVTLLLVPALCVVFHIQYPLTILLKRNQNCLASCISFNRTLTVCLVASFHLQKLRPDLADLRAEPSQLISELWSDDQSSRPQLSVSLASAMHTLLSYFSVPKNVCIALLRSACISVCDLLVYTSVRLLLHFPSASPSHKPSIAAGDHLSSAPHAFEWISHKGCI